MSCMRIDRVNGDGVRLIVLQERDDAAMAQILRRSESRNFGDAETSMSPTYADSVTGSGAQQGPGQPSTAVEKLKDVARVEMGASNYNQSCIFDGKPSVGLAVFQLPGTNALEVADQVRAKMGELKTRFPD